MSPAEEGFLVPRCGAECRLSPDSHPPPCWSLQGHWRTLWWVEPVLSVPCPGALGPSPGFPSGWSMFPGFLSNLELLPDSVIFFGFQICVLFSVVSPIRAVALRNLIVVFVKAGH